MRTCLMGRQEEIGFQYLVVLRLNENAAILCPLLDWFVETMVYTSQTGLI